MKRACVAALALLVAGCVTAGQTDGMGNPIVMTEPKTISPAQTTFNVPDFIDLSYLDRIEQRIRSGVIVHEEYISYGVPMVKTEVSPVGFGDAALYQGDQWFRQELIVAGYEVEQIREVARKGKRLALLADVKMNGKRCTAAKGFYTFLDTKMDYDSTIQVETCPRASDRVELMLYGLALRKPKQVSYFPDPFHLSNDRVAL